MTPLLRLAAGAVAGIIAMSATYPLDMVRGRLTVQADGSAAAYTGLLHATRTIARVEGWGAFYKGWLPSVIGVVPYVGLNFAVYETLKARGNACVARMRPWCAVVASRC
jgi:solute carrier family 25 phosphate transporter 23/24/25/41